MLQDATPTAVDLSLSPIDREWLRDRLLRFGLKPEDVHRTVDFCVAYLALCGLDTRRAVEDFLGDEVVLAELRDVYRTVLRRRPTGDLAVGVSITQALTATARIIESEVLDPVGLVQWGSLLRVRREIGGDLGCREASRGLRQLLVQYPEAIDGLAAVHKVQPSGAAIEPPKPEPAVRAAALPPPAKRSAKVRARAKAKRR